jgi:hypothetical protein
MVEAKHQTKTGRRRRHIVGPHLYITKDELLELSKNPVWRRAAHSFQQMVEQGEIDRCITCGSLQAS